MRSQDFQSCDDQERADVEQTAAAPNQEAQQTGEPERAQGVRPGRKRAQAPYREGATENNGRGHRDSGVAL